MTELRVVPLAEVPEAFAALGAVMRAAWPGWYGPGGEGDAEADLRARAAPGLPRGWAAMEGAEPLGTVGLAATSFGAAPGEAPWLIGLVTRPDRRGEGIGAALIRHVMAEAQGPIFTTTREAHPLFLRLGWRDLRDAPEGWRVMISR